MKDYERVIHKGLSLREAIRIARAHGAEVIESYSTGETLFRHPKMHTRQRVDNKRKDVARTLVYWLRRLREVAPVTPPQRVEVSPVIVRDRSVTLENEPRFLDRVAEARQSIANGNGTPIEKLVGPPLPGKGNHRASVRFVEFWAPRLREAVAAFPEGIKAADAWALIEYPQTSAVLKSRVIAASMVGLFRREKQGVAWMAPTLPAGRKPINRRYKHGLVVSIPVPPPALAEAPPLPETIKAADLQVVVETTAPASHPLAHSPGTLRGEIVAAVEEVAQVWLRLAARLKESTKTS